MTAHFNPVFIGHLHEIPRSIRRFHRQAEGSRRHLGPLADAWDHHHRRRTAPADLRLLRLPRRTVRARVRTERRPRNRPADRFRNRYRCIGNGHPGRPVPRHRPCRLGCSQAPVSGRGRSPSRLADRGILFLGSGNIVHNLRDISFDDNEKPFGWAVEADRWIARQIETGNTDALVNYKNTMPDWRRSIPTSEHFLPLLYILGMNDGARRTSTVYEEMQNGSISMRCVEIASGGKDV